MSLTVGNVTESVDVNTAPPALQTERPDVNYEISPTQVQELPTTSTAERNFQGLYRLIPGVPPPTENNSQAVTANGIVNTVNSTKIDGAAVGYVWGYNSIAQFNARQYFTRYTTTPVTPKHLQRIRRQFKTGSAMTVPLAALRNGNFAGVPA